MFTYSVNRPVTPEQFHDILVRSTLRGRRPVDDPAAIRGMIENANLIVTCWRDELLVGIARSVTDFHYSCYLSDLAVDQAHQRQGIGRRLVALTHEQLGPHARIILLAAPAAEHYYFHLGFEHCSRAWMQDKTGLKKSLE